MVEFGVCYEVETGFSVSMGHARERSQKCLRNFDPEPQEVWALIGPGCCPKHAWCHVGRREAEMLAPQSTGRQVSQESFRKMGLPESLILFLLFTSFYPMGAPFLSLSLFIVVKFT